MNKIVLLVEDTANDIVLMRRAWKKEQVNARLEVVTDGQAALHYLDGKGQYSNREQFPLPCMVLLDLKLPYIMGMEVLAWIRAQSCFKTLPVIILSTSALGSDVDQAYQLGANAYLVKPSDVAQLTEIVRLIRDFWLCANHFSRCHIEGQQSAEKEPMPAQRDIFSHGAEIKL